jgi:hypothetical protein
MAPAGPGPMAGPASTRVRGLDGLQVAGASAQVRI